MQITRPPSSSSSSSSSNSHVYDVKKQEDSDVKPALVFEPICQTSGSLVQKGLVVKSASLRIVTCASVTASVSRYFPRSSNKAITRGSYDFYITIRRKKERKKNWAKT